MGGLLTQGQAGQWRMELDDDGEVLTLEINGPTWTALLETTRRELQEMLAFLNHNQRGQEFAFTRWWHSGKATLVLDDEFPDRMFLRLQAGHAMILTIQGDDCRDFHACLRHALTDVESDAP